ncbi:PLP-dependent aminotransferase family protein [Sutcliffiella horikoshii]|uniref:PLP-dependent aminotransferase family protein n=1 Tax=Sutcliffiella horikoshii TaxID=79883 RepID=A0A5D4T7L9_9BACI|nr:PLP-dependent aminotransferase family protein [Sutcliffiella horikoshii]TYS70492.1 PLP-dependent aminotransferase family protein [Sutcliffiella horikoshii]
MEIQILLNNDKTKYSQIYEQLKQAILERKLASHTKLPSKRRLAEMLNISVITVQIAYEQLQSEGYCYTIQRQGYYVSEIEEEWNYKRKEDIIARKDTSKPEQIINFKNGQVDAAVFPYKLWNRLYRRELIEKNVNSATWQGEYLLREQLSGYLQQARGLSCDPDQVYIYSGFQQQLMNVCLFFKRGTVGMEEPGFIRARSVFEQLHIPYHAVPLDEEGCCVPNIQIKLLYTTPAHQYPTGTIMSVTRRIELIQWARKQDAYIIEDDYDSEFRYKGAPIATLSHLDSSDRIIYFGTLSKTLLPSLRMSYIVIPKSLQLDFERFNTFQKSTVSKIDQLVVAKFFQEGHYSSHIAKMRTLYRNKRSCLIENINKCLGAEYKVIGDAAGLHVILQLPQRLNESIAIKLAKSIGVEIDAISPMYQHQKPSNQVIIGYGEPSMEKIQRGINLLASVWNKVKV